MKYFVFSQGGVLGFSKVATTKCRNFLQNRTLFNRSFTDQMPLHLSGQLQNRCRWILHSVGTWSRNGLFQFFSKVFKLFHSSSFTEKGFVLSRPKDYLDADDKLRANDPSLTLPEYFYYSLFQCSTAFCRTNLKCCNGCGRTSHPNTYCDLSCSDCPSSAHRFHSCPKFLLWLHDPKTSYHSTWLRLVSNWILSYPPPAFKDQGLHYSSSSQSSSSLLSSSYTFLFLLFVPVTSFSQIEHH